MSFFLNIPTASMTEELYRMICAGGLALVLIGIALSAAGLLIMFRPASNAAAGSVKSFGTRIYEASVIGNRSSQQDSCLSSNVIPIHRVRRNGVLGVVCDGMGGLEGGELASHLCAETLLNGYYESEAEVNICRKLEELILLADGQVSKLTTSDGRILSCGTTVVAAAVRNGTAYWASAGDSRIYLIKGSCIQQITRDHNFRITLMERFKAGQIRAEDIENNPQKNSLISFVGKGGNLIVDTGSFGFDSSSGDILLLCSDGLYKALGDNEILQTVSANRKNPGAIPEALISNALKNNMINHDNITVMIID